jgi:ATP-dependent helicase/nuclease subunit A
MAKRPTKDDAARRLASGFDGGLDRTYLVEAGAGTGKTTVLVDRLLAVLRAGTDIERVVAITFTEKAAGELRVRLRGELERAAPEADGREREALERALHDIDRAQVNTIHGFCAGLLKERPVEAGVDPGFGVADELRRRILLDAAWDRWFRDELKRHLPPAVAAARALGFAIPKIRELSEKLVLERDLLGLAPEPEPPADTRGFIEDLRAASREFARVAASSCLDPSDRAALAIGEFARAVEAIDALPEGVRGAYTVTRIKIEPGGRTGSKRNWEEGALDALRERAAALRAKQDELGTVASHNAAVEILRWVEGFVGAYETEKSRQGVLDFQDLLTRARDLLRDSEEVRKHFKNAYDRVLVDEFQDTDPLQCEIVFFLAEAKGRHEPDWTKVRLEPGKLFIVGDPKQSIYRFRRADIEMYEEAKSTIQAQGDVLGLVENFRTRPEIVHEINAVFSPTMRAPEGDRRYQPDYAPLTAYREAADVGPGIVILPPAGPLGEEAGADEVRAAEATAVAAFVERIVADASLPVFDRDEGRWRAPGLRDIALLFHRTTGLPAYEDAFASRSLDYRIAGGKRFYVRREVIELRTALAAIEDPHDLVAVVGALRTPFFGVSDEAIVVHRARAGTLNYLVERPDGAPEVERAFALLRELHVERNVSGIAELLTRLFERTGALELFLLKPDGEQRHANLIKVAELASTLERAEPMSFGGFVRWLREVSQLTPEEAESPLSEEGDEFVRMLTIHKSKGLEFPITILADLGHLSPGRAENIVIDREDKVLAFGVGPADDRLATRDYERLLEFEAERREAELLRLLYVGATRARDALVIPWFPAKDGVDATGLLTRIAGFLEAESGEPVRGLGAGGRAVVRFDTASLDLARKAPRPVRLDTERARAIDHETTEAYAERVAWERWIDGIGDRRHHPAVIVTPSSLALHADSEPVRDEEPVTGASSRGRELGTLVHAVMERVDFASPETARDVTRAIARTAGVDGDLVEEAAGLVERALDTPIMRRAAAARASREVPFCVSLDGVTVEGKIDLLFEEDGGFVVVDYKTDVVPASGADGLVDRYRRQAEAYALAVAQASGRPVKEIVLFFLRSLEAVSLLPSDAGLPPGEALAVFVRAAGDES